MDKLKKDFIIFYLARNALATLIITLCSFVYDFSNYFNITVVRAIIKIFTDNFYITTYFLLLWILNYLLFELYKIIMDTFRNEDKTHAKIIINGKRLVSYGTVIPLIILIIISMINFNQLFKINFILLTLFMLIRSIKEEIKYYKK